MVRILVRPYTAVGLVVMPSEQLLVKEENTEASVGGPIITAYWQGKKYIIDSQ